MKFAVEYISKCSGRLGLLSSIERLADRSYKTPFLLFLNPNLSREVLELSGFNLSSDFGILLPITNIEQMENPLKAFQNGISEFIGLKECLTMITLKNPSEFSLTGHHEKKSVPIFKRSGKLNITSERYMNIINVSNVDFYSSLADADVWNGCPNKRLIKALDRSEDMFDECMKTQNSNRGGLIASVQGGFSEVDRKKFIKHLAEHEDQIFGYFIDGLHRNGHEATLIDIKALKDIVKISVDNLPESKLKFMLGPYFPHVTLELISLGIDVFDTSFITTVTSFNRALVFNFDVNNSTRTFPEIDLMDSKYKDDFTPLAENCDCFACKKQTKAYVNHLLVTRELLGPMLLTIHNLHYYKRFFEAIRVCIRNDKLSELVALVAEQYNDVEKVLNYEPIVKSNDTSKSKRKLGA